MPPIQIGNVVESGRYAPTAQESACAPAICAMNARKTPTRTGAHGRFCASRPLMIVAMSVAWGAASFGPPMPCASPIAYVLSSRKSVPPMTSVEVRTPMMKPICWRRGVAPTRKPVFRSCDVAPGVGGRDADDRADAEGHGLVDVARAAERDEHDAGGHERRDRHAGDRVGRGPDDADDARGDRHEEEAEHDDEEPHHERARERAVRKARQDRDQKREDDRADDDDAHPEIALGPLRAPRFGAGAERLDGLGERRDDRRQRLDERHDAGAGDRAGADVPDVGAVDPLRVRVAGHPGVGEAEVLQVLDDAPVGDEDRDQRNQREPREDAARGELAGDAGPMM